MSQLRKIKQSTTTPDQQKSAFERPLNPKELNAMGVQTGNQEDHKNHQADISFLCIKLVDG